MKRIARLGAVAALPAIAAVAWSMPGHASSARPAEAVAASTAEVPETPYAILLPVGAVVTFGGAYFLVRRGRVAAD
jgi:cytochrome bd-type quinol oxidase subunit 2